MLISYTTRDTLRSRDASLWRDALVEFLPGVGSDVAVEYAGRGQVRLTFDGTPETLLTLAQECPGLRVIVDGKGRRL